MGSLELYAGIQGACRLEETKRELGERSHG